MMHNLISVGSGKEFSGLLKRRDPWKYNSKFKNCSEKKRPHSHRKKKVSERKL